MVSVMTRGPGLRKGPFAEEYLPVGSRVHRASNASERRLCGSYLTPAHEPCLMPREPAVASL
jgi:hypothetical protein